MKVTCCFCGVEISRTEMNPLIIDVSSDGSNAEYRDGVQSFYCHAACFENRLYSKDVPFMWFSEDNDRPE